MMMMMMFSLYPSNACSFHKIIDKRNTQTRIFGPREFLCQCATGVHSVNSVHSVHSVHSAYRCAHGLHVFICLWSEDVKQGPEEPKTVKSSHVVAM